MNNSLEMVLEYLEQSLKEQAVYLKNLQGAELEEHSTRGLEILEKVWADWAEPSEVPPQPTRSLLSRIGALLRQNMALTVAEQRRHGLLLPALCPQPRVYGRSGRFDRSAPMPGASNDQLC